MVKCVYCGEPATLSDPKTLEGGRIHPRCMDAAAAEDDQRMTAEAARQEYEQEMEAQDRDAYFDEQYGEPPEGG